MSFSKAISIARQKLDITQEELAAKIGKTGAFISKLESGKTSTIKTDTLRKLCSVLKLDFISTLLMLKPELKNLLYPPKYEHTPQQQNILNLLDNNVLTESDYADINTFVKFKIQVAEERTKYGKKK